ncbi:hypothetical protein DN588_22520 [Enterobacter cloacae]|nr:hypothetical protein DN588_22520 [Enterobacter cloacae]
MKGLRCGFGVALASSALRRVFVAARRKRVPDGGLSLTTAGKSVTPQTPDEAHRTSRQLAKEEENILIHRHADDPGYDETRMRM